jgi:hypothetical protein
MIDIGKELRHDLRNGVAPPAVLGKLQRTGFAPTESAIILVSAVNTMCPDTKAEVVGWARGNHLWCRFEFVDSRSEYAFSTHSGVGNRHHATPPFCEPTSSARDHFS